MPAGDYNFGPGVRVHRRSYLGNHAACPAYYAADKASRQPQSRPALRGTLVHRAIETMLRAMQGDRGAGSPDPDVAAPIIASAPVEIRADVAELVDRWVRRWVPFPVIETETLLTSVIIPAGDSPDGLEHRIGGRLDLVAQPNQVWDWKTQYRVPGETELKYGSQAAAYAVMASDQWGWPSVEVVIDFLRWGVSRSLFYTLPEIRMAAELIREQILELLATERAVRDGMADVRRPGKHCQYCPLLTTCDVAAPETVKDEADARAAARRILQAEKQLPKLRRLLETWLTSEAGPADGIFEDGSTRFLLGLTGQHRITDVETAAAVLAEGGADLWAVMKVDHAKLKRLLKKKPHLAARLAGLWVDKRRTRLKHQEIK